jgi:hypothetical protein
MTWREKNFNSRGEEEKGSNLPGDIVSGGKMLPPWPDRMNFMREERDCV